MKKLARFQKYKFFSLLTIFIVLLLSFWLNYNINIAILLTLLCWSFYILCIPAFHGKFLLGTPYQIITGKKLLYPEVYLWSAALLLNIFTYFTFRWIYLKALTTHLLLRIISTPWPYWIIILTCTLGTFYKFFVGESNFYSKKYLHYTARALFVCVGIFTFLYLSYKELVILINIRA